MRVSRAVLLATSARRGRCLMSMLSYVQIINAIILMWNSLFDACKKGGWQLGHLLDGTQAEYIRMPFADSCLYPVPQGANERSLLVYSDIIPTGLEVGVLRGTVQPGKSVAIVGAGQYGWGSCRLRHRGRTDRPRLPSVSCASHATLNGACSRLTYDAGPYPFLLSAA